ncbi:LPS export ABC transporter periplasmic protein LptC [Azospirillum sp. RWY-5-1]|uniref:LPS export ABC transporter periplasmic protein LptC n=1 Tax=Azospirillum oleiclasticum TaxID=2735135 RepID=A0ABX2TJ27_9PROT|nr:LPS export ABC transporter periplasmic protein LptC [Azospirillum oleiclasticum]NYZ16268.1 LPS export ABC transporter periplasmic protein LptC [Azospirillum oleiclasticum]NYZ23755.1 LPS export ABC transporter periplasmic protein LptC [Azospirillum oleiclasticum]
MARSEPILVERRPAEARPADPTTAGPSPGLRPLPAELPVLRVHQRRATRPVSRGYSRFVTLLKFVLPALALAMLALVAAWPTLTELPSARIAADKGQLEMIKPRYFSADEQNQPYSLTASRADQSEEQPGLVALDKPEAEMTETGGTWVTLRSDRGWYDRTTGILRMVGGVRVLRDDGSEFTTDEAYSDVRAGTAWGDHHVVGQGPQGEIDAIGFRMSDRGKTMVFLNDSKANVAPGAQAPGVTPAAPRPALLPPVAPPPPALAAAPVTPAPAAGLAPPATPVPPLPRVTVLQSAEVPPDAPAGVALVKPPPRKPAVPAAKGGKP